MWKVVTVAMIWCCLAILGSGRAAMGYEVAKVANGATIAGKIVFAGTPPAPRVFDGQKDPEVCGKERTLTRVVVNEGFLKGAVIVLEGVAKGKPFARQNFRGELPGEGEFRHGGGSGLSLEVRTKGCNFGPFTGVLTPHDPVRFLNHDPMRHTLHTFAVGGEKGGVLRTLHNRHLNPDRVIERTFEEGDLRKSRVVRFACNRHDFMQNWLYVVETPYFSISDEKGQFAIDQVPPGRYQLVAWHPILGLRKKEVTVEEGGQVELNFTFSRAGR